MKALKVLAVVLAATFIFESANAQRLRHHRVLKRHHRHWSRHHHM